LGSSSRIQVFIIPASARAAGTSPAAAPLDALHAAGFDSGEASGDDPSMIDVRATNAAFYDAFERQDLDAMSRVWKQADDVRCAHPGEAPVKGWAAVLTSWARIFESTELFRVRVADVQVRETDGLAVVVCLELITAIANGDAMEATVAATNVFERADGGWLLVHHHGSGLSVRPTAVGMPAPTTIN
jgi:ketosteroid isomerase-like protein